MTIVEEKTEIKQAECCFNCVHGIFELNDEVVDIEGDCCLSCKKVDLGEVCQSFR